MLFRSTGIELIDIIHEELLKSCELTGIWEKKLRDIEHRKYDAADFINGLKQQITEIVYDVLRDNSNRRVTTLTEEDLKKKTKKKASPKTAKPSAKEQKPAAATPTPPSAEQTPTADDSIIGTVCPLCGKGTIIKGRTAYGCSEWRNGCTYRALFKQ